MRYPPNRQINRYSASTCTWYISFHNDSSRRSNLAEETARLLDVNTPCCRLKFRIQSPKELTFSECSFANIEEGATILLRRSGRDSKSILGRFASRSHRTYECSEQASCSATLKLEIGRGYRSISSLLLDIFIMIPLLLEK